MKISKCLFSNKIHELSFADVSSHRKLSILDISYNNFKEINPNVFENLVELKHLNISGNPIVRITRQHLQSLFNVCVCLHPKKEDKIVQRTTFDKSAAATQSEDFNFHHSARVIT